MAPWDLHLGCLKDFSLRKADQAHPAFEMPLIEELLGPLQALNLEERYEAAKPCPFATQEDLWEVYNQTTPAEQDFVSSVLVQSVARATNFLYGDTESGTESQTGRTGQPEDDDRGDDDERGPEPGEPASTVKKTRPSGLSQKTESARASTSGEGDQPPPEE